MTTFRVITIFFSILLFTNMAQAFPEMIRHNYSNCISCHVTPNGGGALSPYGRELSKEVLSTWSYKGEQEPLHGLVKQSQFPSWLYTVGGDVRGLQFHREDQYTRQGDWMWMQMEAEIGLKFKSIHANASVAKFEKEGGDEYVLRRAYLMTPIGKNHYLKVGQFKTNYGLNIANHTTMVKEDLGLGARSEAYSAEFTWLDEKWNYVASVGLPKNEEEKEINEKRFSQQLSYTFNNRFKIAANYLLMKNEIMDKEAYGLSGLMGFNHKLYALWELDVVEKKPVGDITTSGYAFYSKLGYEIYKGIHINGTGEIYQDNWNDNQTKKTSYGAGLQWFPRPHFEFQVAWNKIQINALGEDWSDMAYFLFHYYL